METYQLPAVKWEYRYSIGIDTHSYSFGDREPMLTAEDAQLALSHAVESHNHIPVNILGPLEGEIVSEGRFEGKILFADDLPDGSDYDPSTKRMVEVIIVCFKVRAKTELGE